MKKKDIKILLLQIRKDALARKLEYQNFIKYSGLQENQFTVLNVFDTPEFAPNVINNFNALFIGGSSDASVQKPETYTFLSYGYNLLKHCYNKNIPIYASCFGFQMLVEAFGGKVILDKDSFEIGTIPISINEAGSQDILFHDTEAPFYAVSGHEERAIKLPKDFVNLAYTDLCPYHAIKHISKPIYAFQFHPEWNRQSFVDLLSDYYGRYDDSNEYEYLEKQSRETPESQALIIKFIERILLK